MGARVSGEVRGLAKQHMGRVNDHTPGDPIAPEMTLEVYWKKHYLPWAESNLKPSTLHGYKQVFHQHPQRLRSNL